MRPRAPPSRFSAVHQPAPIGSSWVASSSCAENSAFPFLYGANSTAGRRRPDRLLRPTPRYCRHGRQDTRARHQGWRRQAEGGPRGATELVLPAQHRWRRRSLYAGSCVPVDEPLGPFGECRVGIEGSIEHLVGDVLGHVTRPTFGDVEGNHPKGVYILSGDEVSDDGVAIGLGNVGLEINIREQFTTPPPPRSPARSRAHRQRPRVRARRPVRAASGRAAIPARIGRFRAPRRRSRRAPSALRRERSRRLQRTCSSDQASLSLPMFEAESKMKVAFRSSVFSGTTGSRPCCTIALQHPGGSERRAPAQEHWHVRTHRRVYRTK
jgi:hypothetical protein